MTSREWSLLTWSMLGAAVVVWMVVTRSSRGHLPTLGAVMARLRESPIALVLLVIGWMWLGWHAFAR